jgi:hypothetical protein
MIKMSHDDHTDLAQAQDGDHACSTEAPYAWLQDRYPLAFLRERGDPFRARAVMASRNHGPTTGAVVSHERILQQVL